MKLIFATHNSHKLKEIQSMVPSSIELVSLETLGCYTEILETAKTLEGNARLKADFITDTYQLPCFADDTGLMVNSLNGDPGVCSARYAGLENNSEANIDKLLNNMIGKPNRSAHFKTVIALNLKGKTEVFEGRIDGEITTEKNGTKGFGYDPIFKPNGYDKTFAELPLSVKNQISHRAKAFQKLITYLKTLIT